MSDDWNARPWGNINAWQVCIHYRCLSALTLHLGGPGPTHCPRLLTVKVEVSWGYSHYVSSSPRNIQKDQAAEQVPPKADITEWIWLIEGVQPLCECETKMTLTCPAQGHSRHLATVSGGIFGCHDWERLP